MVTIKVPPVLRHCVDGRRELRVSASTVGEALNSLVRAYPATKWSVYSEHHGLNRYMNVYLNDEDVRVVDGGLEAPVADGDTLVLLPASSGGI